jgi:gluconolactonase
MFFSVPNFRPLVTNYSEPAPLPDAFWRFDPTEKLLTPVITRADALIPNGDRVNANSTLLYVTDSSPSIEGGVLSQGGGFNSSGSPAISRYNLTRNGILINKRLISFARRDIADGIHIDDQGRIWTGENEGIVVRSGDEKTLWILMRNILLRGMSREMHRSRLPILRRRWVHLWCLILRGCGL